MPLINPSFEAGPLGWTTYQLSSVAAEMNIEDKAAGARLVLDGNHSLRFVQKWSILHSGVWQRVSVMPGSRLSFNASGFLLYGDNPDANKIQNIYSKFRVGLDVTGGTDPRSDSIRWASTVGGLKWVFSSVSDIAVSDKATCFVDAHIGLDWPPDIAVAVIDLCSLVEVGPPSLPGSDHGGLEKVEELEGFWRLTWRVPKA